MVLPSVCRHTKRSAPPTLRSMSHTASSHSSGPYSQRLTRSGLVKRWLYGPEEWELAVCDIDLKVGGALRFVWRHTDGRTMGMSGVYREIAPPERLVFTELFDED